MGSESWFGKKREPKLAAPRKARDDEVRVDPQDRPDHLRKRKGAQRIEPFFEDARGPSPKDSKSEPVAGKRARAKATVEDEPADEEEAQPRKRKAKGEGKPANTSPPAVWGNVVALGTAVQQEAQVIRFELP
jgi:hypothetical protein